MRWFGLGLADHFAEMRGDSQLGIKSKPQISQMTDACEIGGFKLGDSAKTVRPGAGIAVWLLVQPRPAES
jgi:hypothetical protein